MSDSTIFSLKQAKNLWLFVFVSGILYLYVGVVYLTTDLVRYKWLSKIFVFAFLANGISEILFHLIIFKQVHAKRLIVSCFNIVLGVFVLLFPLFIILTLPIYIAIALIMRSTVDLYAAKLNKPDLVFTKRFLQVYSWIRVLLALLIIVFTVTNPGSILLTGAALFITGIVNLFYAVGLRRIKL